MSKERVFIYSHTKGNIDYYKVNPRFKVTIKAIDLETGNVDDKEIVEYSIHKNLKMYKIHDPKNRFKDFWVSDDHSLIVLDNKDSKFKKISPVNVLKNVTRYSLVQWNPKTGKNDYIPCSSLEINFDPEITTGADFTVKDYYTFATSDGVFVQDTVALYRPLSQRAVKEVQDKLWTINNIFSAANMTVQYEAKQGIVYGIYKLTSTEHGRKLFKEILELDYDINEPIGSKQLSKIIKEECEKGNYKILDKIKVLGFSIIYSQPETLSFLDLEPVECNLTGDVEKDEEIIQEVTEKVKNTFPKKDIVNSGARANWDQIRQVTGVRGYVANFFGNVIPVPVKKSYAQGLDPEDFFISCYGARKGILDVAENTATSGYLTRKLIYSTISCELDLELDDCGTDLCVRVYVSDLDVAKALIGRYYYKDDTDDTLYCIDNPEEVVGKYIYLRTPILCESKKICKTCYGKLADIHKSKFIGVIASQTIGERSTQLVLRTFHLCIKGDTKLLDINNNLLNAEDVYKIVKSGNPFYTFSCSPNGEIVVSKIIDAHKDRFVKKAIKVTLDNGEEVICTHDHEWMLRDGSYKQAQDLKPGDSLMPVKDNIKVVNIETIDLGAGEYFYDFTVDSEFHNFALGAGVFIHNSGVKQGGKAGKHEDIVTTMNSIQDLDKDIEIESVVDAFNYAVDLWKQFKPYGYLHLVHFEVVTSQRLWAELPDRFVRYRTHIDELEKYETYDDQGNIVDADYKLKLVSIRTVPSLESWFLGMVFQNARKNFIKGIIHPSKESTILEKIVLGQVS